MLENHPVIRYTIYTALLSEVVYQSCRLVIRGFGCLKAWHKNSTQDSLCEVIFTNHDTHDCEECFSNRGAMIARYKEPDGAGVKEVVSRDIFICDDELCASHNLKKIVTVIDQCKYTIDLAMYMFTSFELGFAMQRAVGRGVSIRIIADKEMSHANGSQITDLALASIPVRYPKSRVMMHHKFCILDGTARSMAFRKADKRRKSKVKCQPILLTGSMNWTMQGLSINWENMIMCVDWELEKEYAEEFERLWHICEPFTTQMKTDI